MWNASATVQRSVSAGAVSPEVEHGHTMSQLQFSKYVPAICQAMTVSSRESRLSLFSRLEERVNEY